MGDAEDFTGLTSVFLTSTLAGVAFFSVTGNGGFLTGGKGLAVTGLAVTGLAVTDFASAFFGGITDTAFFAGLATVLTAAFGGGLAAIFLVTDFATGFFAGAAFLAEAGFLAATAFFVAGFFFFCELMVNAPRPDLSLIGNSPEI